jgi:7,8-dihydropterin-6-yl-methyl-4-(beta-D-ribofuranosyl)aminobenzene 5'-phosphate synthase
MLKTKNLKLHTLCENSVDGSGVSAEWGYSILIETGHQRILFDTGTTGIAAENAVRMGIDLTAVDMIVLSHGHYDHTGGLADVLRRIGKETPIIAHPDVFGLKYSRNEETGKTRYAGIPFRKELIESLGGRFEFTTEPRWISDDIVTSGEEPVTTDYETIPDRLCLKTEHGFEQDMMADDASIFLRTDLGLVVATGCAHRGMINVIRHAIDVTGEKNLYMVVGGTHLDGADDGRVEKTIEDLGELNPVWIGASHCTGFPAAARMFNAFPEKFFLNGAGSVVTFPYEK